MIEDWRVPIQTRIDGDHLWIKPRVSSQKPRRLHLEDWIIRLPFGQHAIFHINGASDGRHQRRYEEHRIAIGFAETATLDLPLFREIDERVLLY
ncbi:hypothetical protein [Sphingomonas sp. LT1P40]|uniref:hypothetical protein n=1 Tax=Alteristakelama amylovorans TaxID=3096166 RepID=UPI002FC94FBB